MPLRSADYLVVSAELTAIDLVTPSPRRFCRLTLVRPGWLTTGTLSVGMRGGAPEIERSARVGPVVFERFAPVAESLLRELRLLEGSLAARWGASGQRPWRITVSLDRSDGPGTWILMYPTRPLTDAIGAIRVRGRIRADESLDPEIRDALLAAADPLLARLRATFPPGAPLLP